jgi:hypothetical protein
VPAKANLVMYQGDDYAALVTVADASGNPADLTGWQAHSHIRVGPADKYPDIAAEMVLRVEGDKIILGLHAAETRQLAGQYAWDLQLTSPDGARVTLLAGAVNVTQEVTRLVAA